MKRGEPRLKRLFRRFSHVGVIGFEVIQMASAKADRRVAKADASPLPPSQPAEQANVDAGEQMETTEEFRPFQRRVRVVSVSHDRPRTNNCKFKQSLGNLQKTVH